jgi:hypothetical protein
MSVTGRIDLLQLEAATGDMGKPKESSVKSRDLSKILIERLTEMNWR